MKLLFDANLSRKLVAQLSELYPGSIHVAAVNLLAEFVLRRDAIRITEFAADSTLGLLVLDRQ